MTRPGLFVLLLALALAAPVMADEPAKPAPGGVLDLLPAPVTTRHVLHLADRQLAYSTTAGTLPLRDGKGERTAEIFHVAFAAEPVDPARPVTFLFNGGPGAASGFLMLGGVGPRMVAFREDGGFLPPPSRLIDNPDTWLPFTDLVFVDPVATGYSRSTLDEDETARRFFGVKQDAAAMAAFIRLYLARAGRTLSPIFLAGESYGGFRAAVLGRSLQEDAGVAPSGLVLISPVLDFALLRGDDRSLLPWVAQLPSFAAVHLTRQGADEPAIAARLRDVERWALSDYLVALAAGPDQLPPAILDELATITGLPEALLGRLRGRIPVGTFVKEYDRAGGRILSRYDGTIDGPDPDPSSTMANGPDPVLDRSVPAWTAAFVSYARQELGYATDLHYRLLADGLAGRWDYGMGQGRQGYADAIDDLLAARAVLPTLPILIAHGRTDLVTPYLASRYLIAQMPTMAGSPSIQLEVYAGGHMMYMNAASRHALSIDVADLYRQALTGGAD